MFGSLPLGLLQLKHQKLRTLSAMLGITFAVILICVQLEFREALFVSAVRYHDAMDYDLVMMSPKTDYLIAAKDFPRNRLYQAQGVDGVSSVSPIYSRLGSWRNPADRSSARRIFVVAFDPSDSGFSRILSAEAAEQITVPDQVIFDELGRKEYGPVADMLEGGRPVRTEINDREIFVTDLYRIGTSFGLDGGIITSDLNYLRMFPRQKKSSITIGLVHLDAGQDPEVVRERIMAAIPGDVLVLTPETFKAMEVEHWNSTTPIGYIFAFGAIIGVVVGLIIVYQILFADVQDHLKEYATLQAMGYSPGYLRNVVLQEAVVLAILGFLPGIGLSIVVFGQASAATGLPLEMTTESALQIFGLTVAMCAGSGLLALRKLSGIDPAEVF